jgi:hypothetical protein
MDKQIVEMTDQELIAELKKYMTLEQIATEIDRSYAMIHKVYKGHRTMSVGDRFLIAAILAEEVRKGIKL